MKRFNWSRFLAILVKEFRQIARDKPSVIMAVGMPVIMLLLFGYAVNTDVDHMPTVVWDQSMSQDSREVISSLRNSTYLDPDFYVRGYDEIRRYLDGSSARVAVIIPPDYGKQVQGSGNTTVQVLVDGSDPTAARAAMSAVQTVGFNTGWEVQADRLAQQGGATPVLPVQVETRVWYNPDMKSLVFNIPALIGLIIQNVIAMLTAFSLVREKERGTLEQLVVTPVRPTELMLGKLVPFVIIAFVSLMLILSVGILWFGVPPKGSLLLLILLSMLFVTTVLAIGLLISTISRTQLQAMQMTILLILPSILLSGFIFPRETMPLFLKGLGGIVPLTYFLVIVRGIFLKGIGLEYLWKETLVLATFSLVLFFLAAKRFRKNLD
ncbi:ABC transporter permease subunit [Heliobacillus mobilis]|uniref:Transport permease protein n=1 Tax=Heliobacterium mobile TaxID=28064 RepID=A0A6I3SHM9_HELMO|nr:ABC transporter permease [Heliobacterium mobile]MTV48340.1 ABC transporter permease subunit [Heliobacterium mobile]